MITITVRTSTSVKPERLAVGWFRLLIVSLFNVSFPRQAAPGLRSLFAFVPCQVAPGLRPTPQDSLPVFVRPRLLRRRGDRGCSLPPCFPDAGFLTPGS